MRKLIPILLLIILSSCASYTVQDGYDAIQLPDESGPKLETRYRLILQARENQQGEATVPAAEEEMEYDIAEESPVAAEEVLPSADIPAEENIDEALPDQSESNEQAVEATADAETGITQDQTAAESASIVPEATSEEPEAEDVDLVSYPERLSDITFPYLYTPVNETILKDGNIITARVLLLNLGYQTISQKNLARIMESVADTKPDFIILTGSLENQAEGAMAAGLNAVTLAGGTILYSSRIEFADDDSAIFSLSADKDIEIAPVSYERHLPADTEGIPEWIESIKQSETAETTKVMTTADEMIKDSALLAISSSSPSSQDWTDLTAYAYRYPETFQLSDSLEENGWRDAYRDTHFSAETDSGITSFNGDIYERLDFMYIKYMIPDYAVSFPVAGLTDTIGNLGLIAEFAIP